MTGEAPLVGSGTTSGTKKNAFGPRLEELASETPSYKGKRSETVYELHDSGADHDNEQSDEDAEDTGPSGSTRTNRRRKRKNSYAEDTEHDKEAPSGSRRKKRQNSWERFRDSFVYSTRKRINQALQPGGTAVLVPPKPKSAHGIFAEVFTSSLALNGGFPTIKNARDHWDAMSEDEQTPYREASEYFSKLYKINLKVLVLAQEKLNLLQSSNSADAVLRGFFAETHPESYRDFLAKKASIPGARSYPYPPRPARKKKSAPVHQDRVMQIPTFQDQGYTYSDVRLARGSLRKYNLSPKSYDKALKLLSEENKAKQFLDIRSESREEYLKKAIETDVFY